MSAVLYDTPGPRTKRRTMIASLVAGALILVVLALIVKRLDGQGQLTEEKWGPLINPANEYFPQVWQRFGQALVATLTAALLALVLSLVIGTLLAVARVTSANWYRWFVVGLVELLRGVPVVTAIFFASQVLPALGVGLSTLWYLVIGLTLYNSVVIAEIIRAGINALPRGQSEAAYAVGLTRAQVLRLILLPQAFRIMLPALISQIVVIVKDTSLGFIISYEEFVRTANQIIQFLQNPIPTYVAVASIFIVINYSLGRLAQYTERRLSRARKTPPAPKPSGVAVGAGTV